MHVVDIKILHIRLIPVFRVDNGIYHIKIVEDAGEEGERTGKINLYIEEEAAQPV